MGFTPAKELDEAGARALALRYLARRDHGCEELRVKLQQRGAEADVAAAVVVGLSEQGLVSDQRFAEVFTRQRIARLYGPARIRAELRARGIAVPVIEDVLDLDEEAWREAARTWARKRHRGELDQREKARLYRGGRQRGFSHDQIMAAIDALQA